jgi:hypothetical protein
MGKKNACENHTKGGRQPGAWSHCYHERESIKVKISQDPFIIIILAVARFNDMQNDPELSGKYLGTISRDFVKVADTLKEASYQIRKRGFSDFPIFAVCKEEQPIGQLLIDKVSFDTEWNYYASYLAEFSERELVKEAEEFRNAYKDPDEFCCLFVVDREFTKFVFIPFPED